MLIIYHLLLKLKITLNKFLFKKDNFLVQQLFNLMVFFSLPYFINHLVLILFHNFKLYILIVMLLENSKLLQQNIIPVILLVFQVSKTLSVNLQNFFKIFVLKNL